MMPNQVERNVCTDNGRGAKIVCPYAEASRKSPPMNTEHAGEGIHKYVWYIHMVSVVQTRKLTYGTVGTGRHLHVTFVMHATFR